MSEYPYLYLGSHGDAEKFREADLWEKSFRENVCCARAIEKAIRDSAGDDESIRPGCAKTVLDEYGFKRTGFVLAHSVRTLGPLVKAGAEAEAWSRQFPYSHDGDYGRYYRADTALQNLEEFIGQYQDEFQQLGLFDQQYCDSEAWNTSLIDRVLVLSPNILKEECWSVENQLWLAQGGFGTDPDARGRAVYAVCLADGEESRWNRQDFIGVLDECYLPDWAVAKLEQLRAPRQEQEQHTGPVMG